MEDFSPDAFDPFTNALLRTRFRPCHQRTLLADTTTTTVAREVKILTREIGRLPHKGRKGARATLRTVKCRTLIGNVGNPREKLHRTVRDALPRTMPCVVGQTAIMDGGTLAKELESPDRGPGIANGAPSNRTTALRSTKGSGVRFSPYLEDRVKYLLMRTGHQHRATSQRRGASSGANCRRRTETW